MGAERAVTLSLFSYPFAAPSPGSHPPPPPVESDATLNRRIGVDRLRSQYAFIFPPGINPTLSVRVHVTSMLVRHLNAQSEMEVDAKNLSDLLVKIDGRYRGFKDSVCDEAGRVRRYVNVFVNGLNVRGDPEGLSTPLGDGDEVHILASVAGGAT